MKITNKFKKSGNRTFYFILLFFLLITVFQITSIPKVVGRIQEGARFPDIFSRSFIIYAVYHIVFGVLLFFPDSKKTRAVFIFTLVAFSCGVTLLITPKEIGGDLVLLFAAILSQKYGFLKKRAGLKTLGFAVVLICTRAGTVLMGNNELFRAVNQIAMAGAGFPLLYWLYETDLVQIRQRADDLVSDHHQNTAFAEFGKNIAGIYHDLRNYVSVFESFGTVFHGEDESKSEKALVEYDRYVQKLNQRINGIMFVTKKRDDSEIEEVDIAEIIKAIIYVFEVNDIFKYKVSITSEFPVDPVRLNIKVQPLMRMLENLIRNSCEAIVDDIERRKSTVSGSIKIEVSTEGKAVLIKISDNGPGFPFSYKANILESPQVHENYSTKSEGSGYGLYNIKRSAVLLGASVDMRSEKSQGVTTTISIPVSV